MLKGPAQLSEPGSNDVPRYFDTFPGFYGTGITLTLWYRHCDSGDKATCGIYLVYAGDSGVESESFCWTIWVQNNGFYMDNVDADPPYFYLLDFMSPGQTLNHKVWRHLAFVWNVVDDHFSIYLDGELGVRVPWGSKVSGMDCFSREQPQAGLNGSANASVSGMDCSGREQLQAGLNGSANASVFATGMDCADREQPQGELNGSATGSGTPGRVVGLGHGLASSWKHGGCCRCALACCPVFLACQCTRSKSSHLSLKLSIFLKLSMDVIITFSS